MCGIAGIVHLKGAGVGEADLRPMLAGIKHRGPDDEGVQIDRNVGLGHVRLSILDLSAAGKQPFYSPDGRYSIVYNGEVFNYVELRQELIEQGEKFSTQTDTEVVLRLFMLHGEGFLHRLNGMFAFAIYDKEEQRLFCARDRFGIKPFYYSLQNDRLVFCSEIGPIVEQLTQSPNPQLDVVFDYLTFNRVDQSDATFFKEVKKLWHGHTMTVNTATGTMHMKRWYDLKDHVHTGFKNSEEYAESLSRSVKLRLRSDVPVGVCLSGGLDSSSIVSLLVHRHGLPDINTFSAVYGDGVRGDESSFINLYRPELKNMFFTYPDASGLFADHTDFIRAHGEPMSTTAPYAQYSVMKLARDHVKVTLDGQGADEALAGYHYLFGFYFKELLREFKWAKLLAESSAYVSVHHSSYGLKAMAFTLLPSALRSRFQAARKGYLHSEFFQTYAATSHASDNLYNAASLNEALYNHFEHKLEHLLKWSDRNSMRFSIESRTPFLDYQLVEKTLATPSSQKLNKGWTKFILRNAMKGILPEQIRMRKDKMGFITPEDEWFRTPEFSELILDTITSQSFRERKLIDPVIAEKLYRKHLDREINISKDIWKWLNLELWFQQFIDRP